MSEFNEKHLAIGFLQLLIFILCFCGVFFIYIQMYPENKYNDSYFDSLTHFLNADSNDNTKSEKVSLIDSFIKGKSCIETVITDKTLDLKNFKIWVNEQQRQVADLLTVSCFLSVAIYLLSGLGQFYWFVRDKTVACIPVVFTACFVIPIFIPFCLVGCVPFVLCLMILGCISPLSVPVGLISHFGISIYHAVKKANPKTQKRKSLNSLFKKIGEDIKEHFSDDTEQSDNDKTTLPSGYYETNKKR